MCVYVCEWVEWVEERVVWVSDEVEHNVPRCVCIGGVCVCGEEGRGRREGAGEGRGDLQWSSLGLLGV